MSKNSNGSRTRTPRPRPSPPSGDDDLFRELRALVDGLRDEISSLREQLSQLHRTPSARIAPDEAADRLGISRRTLDKLEGLGEIEAVDVGGQVRYEASELADFIERNRRGGDRDE